MKYVSWIILISVEHFFTVQAVVFIRYSVINSTKAEGTERMILRIDKDLKCCLACETDDKCIAVNHNQDDQMCELLYRQTNKLFVLTTAVGWTAYFKSLKDVDPLSNAVASQSSDYNKKASASRAIDGTYSHNDGPCTHTVSGGIRWWMVDFQSQFSVSSVILWARWQSGEWFRLRDLWITVGNSLHAVNNKYNLCGHYIGSTSSDQENPVRIKCPRVMYGRYLKIEKQLPEDVALILCEVEVEQ